MILQFREPCGSNFLNAKKNAFENTSNEQVELRWANKQTNNTGYK